MHGAGYGHRERRPLLGGGFASRYTAHYGGAASPEPEEANEGQRTVRFSDAQAGDAVEAARATATNVTERRQQLRRRMSRSFSRGLSASELKEWHAEHSWRTKIFMSADHMFYSSIAWMYGFVLFVVTLASCLAFVLSTMPAFTYRPTSCKKPVCVPDTPGAACTRTICYPEPYAILGRIEDATMVVFVLDYLLRVLTVHAVPQRLIYWSGRRVHERAYGDPQPSGLSKTLHYMTHINQVVDVLVIIPFIFHAFFKGFVQLRLLRVTRVLRVLKLSRYSSGGTLVWRTLKNSGPALGLITTFTIVLSFLVGSLIYYFEQGTFKVTPEHPEGAFMRPSITGGEEVSPFTSAASGAYWVFVTATTVGYGDLYPTSGSGQVIAGLVALVGVVFLSLPIAIVVKHFNLSYDLTVEEDELEKALLFEEEQAARAQGGKPDTPVDDDRRAQLRAAEAKWRQQHAASVNALRAFLLDQMQHATPLFAQMYEEFAAKHLLQKLEQKDRAAVAAASLAMDDAV